MLWRGRWVLQKRHLQKQLLPATSFSSWTRPSRGGARLVPGVKKPSDKSEWWVIDGEMHEIGDNVPPRERFAIPRDNIPNRRRKQMREQFMRRTRLVLKETEHEPWCKRYMELYQELRDNWERLYWDEGYSKKLAQDHANYESEEDDIDFSPNRGRHFNPQHIQDQRFGSNKPGDTWNRTEIIRDKFEYDRERRMREKAFAPIARGGSDRGFGFHNTNPRSQPFDVNKFFPENSRE
ncbi:uncharacterized protein LOC116266744 isoform X2 [Nymphaea colorata]|uniref:uncharacterized protein LOC116266744 isoform X2 n=1 Tax=Nymphaea colorata TaxID=210225 RepID=UPI00129D5120|nr:uncharacterized protein LOC116266744 isoform X2 [Nymphaea colorata]